MKYIFTMSAAGSIMLLCAYLSGYKRIKIFSCKMQDILLKFSIFYYLIPLIFLREFYWDFVYCLPLKLPQYEVQIIEFDYYYDIADGHMQFNTAYKKQIGLFFIWMVVAMLILLVRTGRYIRKRKRLLAAAEQISQGPAMEILEDIRSALKIKRKIRLYDTKTAAFTMGIFSPVICFDGSVAKEQLEMILYHECKHIRRMDTLTRQFANLAVCIHWFNPFVYFLPKKAERICEVCCDEAVIKGVGYAKSAEYARMLVDNMDRSQPIFLLSSALSKDARIVKERIVCIMKPKKRKKVQTILAVVLVGVVFFMDSWTALAYPKVYDAGLGEEVEFSPDMEIYLVPEGMEGPFPIPEYTVLYDNQFVDEEGNIYPVYEGEVVAYETHTHKWLSGEQQEHKTDANGGCTMTVYASTYCPTCRMAGEKTFICETRFAVCIH